MLHPRPTIPRPVTDRMLRVPVRLALLGEHSLPDSRWMRVHGGWGRPLGVFPELAASAGLTLCEALRRLLAQLEAVATPHPSFA